MDAAQYLDDLRRRSAALISGASTDLAASVPSCPGWTVTDLVAHIGGVWGWAAGTIRAKARSEFRPSAQGLDDTQLIEWATEQSIQVITALESVDPDSESWTFGPPRSALFWFRRQALETAVHAWDVDQAVATPESIDSGLARDGIDEFLAVMLPRAIDHNPGIWRGESFHLHRTDGTGEWLVHLGPGSSVTVELAHGKGDVAIRGTASSLYLWMLNRLPSDSVEIFGDRALADRWTDEIAI